MTLDSNPYLSRMKNIVLLSFILFSCNQDASFSLESHHPISLEHAYRFTDSTDLFSIAVPDSTWKSERMLMESGSSDILKHSSVINLYSPVGEDNLQYMVGISCLQYDSTFYLSSENTIDENVIIRQLQESNAEAALIKTGEIELNNHNWNYIAVDNSGTFPSEHTFDEVYRSEFNYLLNRVAPETRRTWSILISRTQTDGPEINMEFIEGKVESLLPIIESLEINPDFEAERE